MEWMYSKAADSVEIYFSLGIGEIHHSPREISNLSILFTVRVKAVYRIEPPRWPSDPESASYGQAWKKTEQNEQLHLKLTNLHGQGVSQQHSSAENKHIKIDLYCCILDLKTKSKTKPDIVFLWH